MASLKDTIQEINNKYAAILSRPGAPGVGEFFTEDADLLPPGPDNLNLKGPAAIQAFWAAVTEQAGDVRLTTIDAAPIGEDAVREIGNYFARIKGTDQGTLSGKYVFIWRKVGDDWKIWTDIWTSHSGQT
jgi:ketosteroid isomerase-like protein